jgi:CheY-like chemotaxis protein
LGRGTAVRLVFSIKQRQGTITAVPASRAPARSLRILLVDDDPFLLEALQHTLRDDGHKVTTANGGQAGIDTFLAAQHRPEESFEAVITDLGMPYVDGRKVADRVSAIAPRTPIILLTGWGQRLSTDSDWPQVFHVLSKPPRLDDLRDALARCCALHSSG